MLPRARPSILVGRRERRHELTGAEFGALLVLGFAGRGKASGHARWTAECRVSHGGCGGTIVRRASDLEGHEHCGCREGRRLVTFQGRTLPLTAWERELRGKGLHLGWRTIKTRLRAGWTPERALTTPAAREVRWEQLVLSGLGVAPRRPALVVAVAPKPARRGRAKTRRRRGPDVRQLAMPFMATGRSA